VTGGFQSMPPSRKCESDRGLSEYAAFTKKRNDRGLSEYAAFTKKRNDRGLSEYAAFTKKAGRSRFTNASSPRVLSPPRGQKHGEASREKRTPGLRQHGHAKEMTIRAEIFLDLRSQECRLDLTWTAMSTCLGGGVREGEAEDGWLITYRPDHPTENKRGKGATMGTNILRLDVFPMSSH
jgi:hypothetical protein